VRQLPEMPDAQTRQVLKRKARPVAKDTGSLYPNRGPQAEARPEASPKSLSSIAKCQDRQEEATEC